MAKKREFVKRSAVAHRLKRAGRFLAASLAALYLVSTGFQQSAEARRIVQNSCAKQVDFTMPAEDELGEKTLRGPQYEPLAPGEKIPCTVWIERRPMAAMLCIHGFGLHKGTYDAFANEMAKRGIATYAIDCRGFGNWVQKGRDRIDFDGTMADIGVTLQEIKRLQPGLKVIVLGESMGGAIAMKTAEMYPTLVDGLISSVPAGDRYDQANSEIGIVKHILLHGWKSPIDVGPSVVDHATKKEDLRRAWLGDPLSRTKVTPSELMMFQKFMNSTFEMAPNIKETKVLFVQGCNDKLVRPAGTWKLFQSLATPAREMVLSKSAEHLIFEDGQFSDQDLHFVTSWISKTIAPIDGGTVASTKPGATIRVASGTKPGSSTKIASNTTSNTSTTGSTASGIAASDTTTGTASGTNTNSNTTRKTALSYWIELKRNGKVFRCNNKTAFKSGDAIRFHFMAETDGYAYVVLEQGSTGKSAVLFPSQDTGKNNFLHRGVDYPLPYQDWLAFDAHPGLEKVRIVFSKEPIKMDSSFNKIDNRSIAYVSADQTGAKDLIGTRMQLSWDEANPVIMPDEVESSALAAAPSRSSQVRLLFDHADGPCAVDVALLHQ